MPDVSIDSASTRVDLYAPTESVQVPVFTASGLTAGTHTLRIDIPGVDRWSARDDHGAGRHRVVALVDTSTAVQEGYQAVLFSATGLTAGDHVLTIDVIGRNGEPAGATVGRVVGDAFDVY